MKILKNFTLVFFSLSFLTLSKPAFSQTKPLLFRNIQVFDGERLIKQTSVLVQNGLIKEIEPNLNVPPDSTIIDGKGKTLLPGLIDAHVHLYDPIHLRQASVFGVTTQLDMFSLPKSFNYLRSLLNTPLGNEISDFRTSGLLATAPGGHGTEYGFEIPTITHPNQAKKFIEARLKEGSDYIKIVYDNYKVYDMEKPTLSYAILKSLIEETHAHQKMAIVHIGSIKEALEAIEADADGLAHLSVENLISPELITLAKQKQIFIIPTMTVLESICGIKSGLSLLKRPLINYLPPQAIKNLSQSIQTGQPNDNISCNQSMQYIKALHLSGVPLLIGSDTPNSGTSYGVSVHRELELFVQAGISQIEALKSATSIPAQHFKLSDRGQIKVGLRADLLLVKGDPTQNITDTRNILGVWKKGNQVNREAYQQSFDSQKSTSIISSGLVSNFSDKNIRALKGSNWTISTDKMLGGNSIAQLSWDPDSVDHLNGSLSISGQLNPNSKNQSWAGGIYYPGKKSLETADFSKIKHLNFWTKGDGKTYQILIFSGKDYHPPAIIEFSTTSQWKQIKVNLENITGIYRQEIWGILFANRLTNGPFRFQIDQVNLE